MMTRWYRPSLEPKKNIKLRLVASITYYVSQSVFPIYLSHFSSEWTEIRHDDSLDGIDQVLPLDGRVPSGAYIARPLLSTWLTLSLLDLYIWV